MGIATPPLAGRVTDYYFRTARDVDDRLIAEAHDYGDSDPCVCEPCERDREAREQRTRIAMEEGGLLPAASELFGGRGWLFTAEEKARNAMEQAQARDQYAVQRMAQRSMGEVFAQIGRIGAHGEELCIGKYTVDLPSPPSSVDVLELIIMLDRAVEYARAQLGWLPATAPAHQVDSNGDPL